MHPNFRLSNLKLNHVNRFKSFFVHYHQFLGELKATKTNKEEEEKRRKISLRDSES